MLKTTVLQARNDGIRLKKRRFLKLILIFSGIKQGYDIDYQLLAHNAKNRRFLSSNDNVPANIGCMYAYNSLFVKFIRINCRGVIHHVPSLQARRNVCWIFGGRGGT